MNKLYILISVFFLGILFSFTADNSGNEKDKLILDLIREGLQNYFYSEKKIDNDFSEDVYKLYLKKLDYNKRFLLQSDVNQFAAYKYKIDDAVKTDDFTFFNLTKDVYIKRVSEINKYIDAALKKPFDFTKNDSLQLEPDKRPFAKTKKELMQYWRQFLKYAVMTKVAEKLETQEEAKKNNDTTVEIKTEIQLQEKAVEEVKKNYDDWYHRISKVDENDLLNLYFNSITGYYGPHTGYFPPKDKENFDIQISGKLEGIGAQLSQPNAYIKVVKIIPGSPCWKQGELGVGDKILKVAQGDKEPVNVVDMRLDKAIEMIRGKKGTEVKLTVKKTDGTIKVIPIIRDIIILEETFAKSAVIEDSVSGKRTGYIYLPGFYADFNHKNGRRSAGDVKKEIQKLKKEHINGLILDLRNNGGGSLQDAIDIVGFFIKDGPVVQVKQRTGMPQILKDRNSEILYDGDLVVMVNEFSASASEITAAAIQDYGRGIIVGSEHTFGKGTVQRFLPFDRMVRGNDSLKPLGDLKLTIQKFYRINGGATQLKGVESDIVFPDAYAKLDMGEKDLENPMPWDEIPKAEYKKFKVKYKLSEIKMKSEKRVNSDTSFNIIKDYSGKMKYYNDKDYTSLNLKKYMKDAELRSKFSKRFRKADNRVSNLKFYIPKADSANVYSDTVKTRRVISWFKDLKRDIYLNETFKIVSDINK
ncbi:MAG: tail-specific protease [Chlorobi bacterium]|nr:tail-specific protease [Chlorobiota bacterium]